MRAVGDDAGSSGCPYEAWKLYLPHDEYAKGAAVAAQVKAAQVFLRGRRDAEGEDELHREKRFSVDLREVAADERLREAWGDFEADLARSSERVWAVFSLARHQNVLDDTKAEMSRQAESG